MLRIGWIDYANCTPIFTALTRHFDCRGYTFVKGVPAELNDMLCDGSIDIAPSSSIEYARHHEQYLLMPGLSISSFGPVKSVLLFSRKPIEELNHRPIGLTSESAASVVLLKVLLTNFMGFANQYERCDKYPEKALDLYDAVLLIGDSALRFAQADHGCHVYDLGALWYQACGLPFVFALWIVREDAVLDRIDEVKLLWKNLVAAKNVARISYEQFAAGSSCSKLLGHAGLVDYWKSISYDLGDEHLEGLKLYYHHASELGLLAHIPEIRLLNEL